MSRTLIDVDEDALTRAASVLGTTTKVDTVNQALRMVAQSADQEVVKAEYEHFDALLDLIGDRLAETDVRAEAWR